MLRYFDGQRVMHDGQSDGHSRRRHGPLLGAARGGEGGTSAVTKEPDARGQVRISAAYTHW